MKAKHVAILIFALLVCGCAQKAPPPAGPRVMPLTMENARACERTVEAAKERFGGPEDVSGQEAFTRYMAAVYAAPLKGEWLVRETLAAAATEINGNQAARLILKCLVYDPQLTAALTGQAFDLGQWREMYVRAGILDAATFDLLDQAGASREASQ